MNELYSNLEEPFNIFLNHVIQYMLQIGHNLSVYTWTVKRLYNESLLVVPSCGFLVYFQEKFLWKCPTGRLSFLHLSSRSLVYKPIDQVLSDTF